MIRGILARYSWPGNVRELQNAIVRASIWSSDSTIRSEDVREALSFPTSHVAEDLMNRALDDQFKLADMIGELARHYIARALTETGGNRKQAADLLGFSNYQTLSNWIRKYDVKE